MQESEQKPIFEVSGQSVGAVGAIIALVVGVGVATLILIFVGVLGGQAYQISEAQIDKIGLFTGINENFTALNGSAQSVGYSNLVEGSLSINNGTNAVTLGNFTVDYGAGTIMLITDAPYNNTNMTASFNYENLTVRNYVDEGIISGFAALKQTGDYLPLIVLAVIIMLVLGLVLGFSAFGSRGGSGSAL